MTGEFNMQKGDHNRHYGQSCQMSPFHSPAFYLYNVLRETSSIYLHKIWKAFSQNLLFASSPYYLEHLNCHVKMSCIFFLNILYLYI